MRTGGDLVAETLVALGATTVFGEPGQHALAMFDALRRSPLRYVGCRTELGVAFAADGHARATGTVTPFMVSTGPGALATLPALMESRLACAPVVGISSQIPSDGLGGRRKGYLHELPDQAASFRGVATSVQVVRAASQIPSALAQAWEAALSVPQGPAWVEIPQDILLAPADVPAVSGPSVHPRVPRPRPELVRQAVRTLDSASNPVILAGGGVNLSGAGPELLALAERLRAPVATTFAAKGVFPREHPLSLQSWLEDRFVTDFLEEADVLLVAGSGLGELSSNYHTMRPRGRVVHVEADPGKLEANTSGAPAVHGDAKATLGALAAGVRPREGDGRAEAAVADVLRRVRDRLSGHEQEFALLEAVPSGVPSFWDMTILTYWAWSAFPGHMWSAQGAGGLGYALPAALGAAATGRRALAISGDGGAMYGLAELATLRQHDLDVTWLIVDDGGYGILREYMTGAFGTSTGTELARPDFAALAASFGVAARVATPDSLAADLAAALSEPGPNVVVLHARPRMFAPT
ncbi:thiamine pyrophosphate-binding protein [Nonomuraea mesophila]|uniref:Thiamine pyrophosphate-binding protein n=1 Tax=Nonomuraea mesophila TaxID=2530382 RepID=A0A4R5F565_9ACTN|nr:thiamine pyrophosphate-binding protein [Nonomuraea mesophila]TDE42395.1 thiamine pyrophosphate-binding protein [Nonomuraea mesophila]